MLVIEGNIPLQVPFSRLWNPEKASIKRPLPIDWQECTPVQCMHLHAYITGLNARTTWQQTEQFLQKFFNLPPTVIHSLTPVQLRQIVDEFQWAYQLMQHERPLRPRLFGLIGPQKELRNFSFIQYLWAEQCKRTWIETGNNKWLNNFLACAYRIPGVPFNKNRVEAVGKFINHIPRQHRIQAALSYIGQRNHAVRIWPELFEGDSNKPSQLNIDQMVLALAGEKFGTYEQMCQQPYMRVMSYLQYLEIERRKQPNNGKPQPVSLEKLYAAAGYKRVPDWA